MSNDSRRKFLKSVGTAAALSPLVACGAASVPEVSRSKSLNDDADSVVLYDTYAMAMYFDGSIGPTTGIVTAAEMAAGVALPRVFLHGHGGIDHRFTVQPAHLALMREKKRAYMQTDDVEGHSHRLFVDTSDARWRVPGSRPVRVPRRPAGAGG